MDIDVKLLRGLAQEKEIPFELLVEAIESALLIAYHRTEGARRHARAVLDRQTGHVTVWAKEDPSELEEGQEPKEFDDTPSDFGRIAATTARQVIQQRLRDAENDVTFGEYARREGDVVAGVVQQGKDPKNVLVKLDDKLEAVLPVQEQVPGEDYTHGLRLRTYVVRVAKGVRGPSVTLSRTHPNLVKKLFALEVPEIADGSVEIAAIAREAATARRSPCAPPVPGSTPRAPASARWAAASATSWPNCSARRSTSSTGPTTPPRWWPTRCPRPGSPRSRSSTCPPGPPG